MIRTTPVLFLAVIVSSPALAQPSQQPSHHQSIGTGAHWALPYSERGSPPGVQLSWRRWFSPRFGLGTDFRWWARNTTREINSPAQQGPGGVFIRSQQGREEQWLSSYGFGIGVLARRSSGRLSFIGGAGPGFFVDRTVHETQINEMHDSGRFTLRSVGVHLLGEAELQATTRLSAFVGVRLELRDPRHVESGSGYPTVGVRFAF